MVSSLEQRKKAVKAAKAKIAHSKVKLGGFPAIMSPVSVPTSVTYQEPKLKWIITTKKSYSNQREFKIEGQLHFMASLIKLRDNSEIGELWIPVEDIEAIVKLPV